jgi:hypothetical protein
LRSDLACQEFPQQLINDHQIGEPARAFSEECRAGLNNIQLR